MSAANKVYQAHLDAVSTALWRGEYSILADKMYYPHKITNNDAELQVDTKEQMIASARLFRDSLIRMGTSDYHRTCVKADFADETETVIHGEHLTYALRAGTYAIEPMVAYMTLRQVGTEWFGAGIRYVAANRDLPVYTAPTTALDTDRVAKVACPDRNISS